MNACIPGPGNDVRIESVCHDYDSRSRSMSLQSSHKVDGSAGETVCIDDEERRKVVMNGRQAREAIDDLMPHGKACLREDAFQSEAEDMISTDREYDSSREVSTIEREASSVNAMRWHGPATLSLNRHLFFFVL